MISMITKSVHVTVRINTWKLSDAIWLDKTWFLPEDTKPLPQPMLTDDLWGRVAFTWWQYGMTLILDMCLQIINSRLQPHVQRANELNLKMCLSLYHPSKRVSPTSKLIYSQCFRQEKNCLFCSQLTTFHIIMQIKTMTQIIYIYCYKFLYLQP